MVVQPGTARCFPPSISRLGNPLLLGERGKGNVKAFQFSALKVHERRTRRTSNEFVRHDIEQKPKEIGICQISTSANCDGRFRGPENKSSRGSRSVQTAGDSQT